MNDKNLLHGAALDLLVRSSTELTLRYDRPLGVVFVDSRQLQLALLLKTSTKPKSSWQFKLTPGDASAIRAIRARSSAVRIVLGLVCFKDGVCSLPVEDLSLIGLSLDSLADATISVARLPGTSYRVSGPGRTRLSRTIAACEWERLASDSCSWAPGSASRPQLAS